MGISSCGDPYSDAQRAREVARDFCNVSTATIQQAEECFKKNAPPKKGTGSAIDPSDPLFVFGRMASAPTQNPQAGHRHMEVSISGWPSGASEESYGGGADDAPGDVPA